MADAVEIYICKKGQSLQDGKVEYSQALHDKSDAEEDAKARIQNDPSIHRIAYYKINDAGDFRVFYSFTKQSQAEDKSKGTRETAKNKKPKNKRPQKKSFWQKLFGSN